MKCCLICSFFCQKSQQVNEKYSEKKLLSGSIEELKPNHTATLNDVAPITWKKETYAKLRICNEAFSWIIRWKNVKCTLKKYDNFSSLFQGEKNTVPNT